MKRSPQFSSSKPNLPLKAVVFPRIIRYAQASIFDDEAAHQFGNFHNPSLRPCLNTEMPGYSLHGSNELYEQPRLCQSAKNIVSAVDQVNCSAMMSFLRNKFLPSRFAQLFIKTFRKWQKDQCLEMGAAISYYALFSLFPIALVIVSILGFLLGPDTNVFQQILTFTQNSLPPEAFEIVKDTLMQLNEQSLGAGIVGFFLTFFAASGIFGALDRSVDRIWKATQNQSEDASLISSTTSFLGKKLIAFALVMSTSLLLLLSLISNIAIRVILDIVGRLNRTITFFDTNNLPIATFLQFSASFLLVALAVLLLLRFLPSTFIPWKDLWPGTLATTFLLIGLQQLVSRNIIQIGGQYQSYGAIGGVMILMLWIYFTCQIFLLGCELSYIYAYLFGSRRNHELPI